MDIQYKIIGGDGGEYGPATLDELTSWIGEGRVAGATQVWRSDLARWSPAGRYVELQAALARLHASVSPAAVNQTLRATGFWPRCAAYLLDRVALSLVFGMFLGPFAAWNHWTMPVMPQVLNPETLRQFWQQMGVFSYQAAPALYGLIVLYDVLMNGAFGATLGKMAIGAKIIRVDGSRLGYTHALLRSLAGRLIEFTLCLGYFWIVLRSDKRGWHDLIAGTKVVYLR